MPQTYYQVLGVSLNATAAEIEAAFKSKASEVHPDRISPSNAYLQKIAAEAFKNLSEAKAVLLDPDKRRKYDAELSFSRGSSANPTAAAAAAAAATQSAAPLHPLSRLVNARSTGLALLSGGIVCAVLLLAAKISFQSVGGQPPVATPAANSAENPAVAHPCENGTESNCAGAAGLRGSGSPPAPGKVAKPDSTPREQRKHAGSGEGYAGSPLSHSDRSPSRTITEWRASEPPDLSTVDSSERQTIEAACSYARQMESPEAYNGCLTKELALRASVPNRPAIPR